MAKAVKHHEFTQDTSSVKFHAHLIPCVDCFMKNMHWLGTSKEPSYFTSWLQNDGFNKKPDGREVIYALATYNINRLVTLNYLKCCSKAVVYRILSLPFPYIAETFTAFTSLTSRIYKSNSSRWSLLWAVASCKQILAPATSLSNRREPFGVCRDAFHYSDLSSVTGNKSALLCQRQQTLRTTISRKLTIIRTICYPAES